MNKEKIRSHFAALAETYDHWRRRNSYYHEELRRFLTREIRPDERVIELGCATGGLIGQLPGARRVGLDFAPGLVDRARQQFPAVHFAEHDCERPYGEPAQFDVVVAQDLVDHVTDIFGLFANINHLLRPGGRAYITTINPLWQPLLRFAEALGMKMPEGEHNFVPNRYLVDYLRLHGLELMEYGAALLLPVRMPLLASLLNRVAPLLPIVNRLCVVQTLIVRKAQAYPAEFASPQTCTVVIPCFNEQGNIAQACRRIPAMGGGTEIIVVDDGSRDGTADAVRQVAAQDPRVKLITYTPNHGKGYAVKQGFDHAQGDIIMILDADMTVMPEDLPRFFRPIAEGRADFTNGTRMIYPMEHQAMRFLNLLGNFFFGTTMTWLVSQRLSDTLCGTKALRRRDYPHIPMGGDKWGDFDLLFGAAENRLKIAEIPIHYQARVEGISKMKPFRHSLVLLKMCLRGFLRLKLKCRRV